MTAQRDLKKLIRARQAKTGESYTAARAHVMRERAVRLGLEESAPNSTTSTRLDAVVLKVNQRSARVRIPGEDGEVTFRSGDLVDLVPGHLVTLDVSRRWTWRGSAYASGRIENPRIDVGKLGLVPLPLHGGDMVNLRGDGRPPFGNSDPYTPVWLGLTDRPREEFEMDSIAWDGADTSCEEYTRMCRAAELIEVEDFEAARDLLMEVLATELRCIDAHAHLGTIAFGRFPHRACNHFQMGVEIGDLSLPAGFDGVLPWGGIDNRPFLRCLNGYGLSLWRLGRLLDAQQVFMRLLSLNPDDEQGARNSWFDISRGMSWEDSRDRAEAERAVHWRSLH